MVILWVVRVFWKLTHGPKRVLTVHLSLSLSLSLSQIVTYRIIPVMQSMQTVQTKCNVFEVATVRLYSSLKMRKHLSANGQS